MHLIKTLAALVVLTATLHPALAAPTWAERIEYRAEENKFSDQEWRYDLYPTWRFLRDEAAGDGKFGMGAGVNYFFDRYWGVGADTAMRNFDFPNQLNLSFIGRYPNEMIATAPYVFAGGGRQFFDGTKWMMHLGGGVDYRWNSSTGVFIDVRHTFAIERPDFFLIRFGFRFGF